MLKSRRVVVTGLGAVSPLGCTVEKTWGNVLSGVSGAKPITYFDTTDYLTKFAATVSDFDASLALSVKDTRRIDTFVQYAAECSRQALLDADLPLLPEDYQSRFGVAIGSGVGGMEFIQTAADKISSGRPRRISPFFVPGMIINMASGYVSMQHRLRGPNLSVVTACASAAHSIGMAARMIACGDADLMLAGGTERASVQIGIGGFNAVKALSTRNDDPTKASRPWDKDRDGFLLGDGAAVLVLESLEHAQSRGATIYAEFAGLGMSGDAYHMTAAEPDGTGMALSMQNALDNAGMTAADIDYINAHGTSTPLADPIEVKAIKTVFGDDAYRLAVSSTKSMTGHLLGAAGGIEALFAVLAIRDNIAPPTINLDNPDEGCDLDFVPHKAREMSINTVLSNSFGFGGTNCSLVFKRVE